MEHVIPSPSSSRRSFLSSLAVSAASLSMVSFRPTDLGDAISPPVRDTNDPENWINRIKGKHKMVFDVPHPNGIYPFGWPRVFLMTNEATGATENECCAVVILRHSGIAYAFDHPMWEKYGFGKVFDVMDANKNPVSRNPFWQPPKGAFSVPGIGEVQIGINELQKSGIMFGVCSMAITVFSTTVAGNMNMTAEDVRKDWLAHLLPGIQVIPSGIWGLGRAQEKGCGYIYAG